MRVLRMAALLGAGLVLLAGCRAPDPQHDGHEIAGGGLTGVYYAYGHNLAEALQSELGLGIVVAETNGSVDNLHRISAGEALLGFAQSDTAADAVAGTGAFTEPLPIMAVARLYDEYVHIVVRADSDILSIADLAGRGISLGAENSGVNVVALRILNAAGVAAESVQNPKLGLDASILAFESSDIEGFFWIGGLPTPGIVQLAEKIPTRLLTVEAGIVEQVNERHGGVYRFAEFPRGVYEGDGSTQTMTVPSFLVTHREASAELIRDALRVLFDERVRIAAQVPAAALLDRRQAIFTDPLELHPGAVDYFSTTRR